MAGQVQIVDLANCKTAMSDLRACEGLVRFLADTTGMTRMGMLSLDLANSLEQQPGVSVVALIGESHIAVHTWPEHGHVNFTMDSCKLFNTMAVTERIVGFFEGTIERNQVFPRWGPDAGSA